MRKKRKIAVLVITVAAGLLLFAIARYEIGLPLFGHSWCYSGLEEIDVAKQYWALENDKSLGANVTLSDLRPNYLTKIPRCPDGGTYEIGKLGENPTCSKKGHWHERHFFLNYARPEFVLGKQVRIESTSTNEPDGAYVGQYRIEGRQRWSLLQSGRKVTVFGVLAEKATSTNKAFVVRQSDYQFGWSYDESANACLNGLRQIDSAKQQWALERSKGNDATVKMSELVQVGYLRSLPTCQSGGIYIVGKISESPTCILHKNALP